jgi:hypothetical protein
LSIVCDLEQTNQLNLLPDKDLVDLCPPIEPYQVTKSRFYVGQHLYHWLQLHQMFQKNIEELMQISRYRLKDYIKGQRAISLALSTF